MSRCKRIVLFTLFTMMLIMIPLSAFSQNVTWEEQVRQKEYFPDPAAMVVDLVIARPAGLVATVGGTAFFVISLPFSALGGNSGDAWESLVVSPAVYTFKRPLGEFEE